MSNNSSPQEICPQIQLDLDEDDDQETPAKAVGRVNGAKSWKPNENLFLIEQAEARSLSNEVNEKDERWTKISQASQAEFGGTRRSNSALKDHFKGIIINSLLFFYKIIYDRFKIMIPYFKIKIIILHSLEVAVVARCHI